MFSFLRNAAGKRREEARELLRHEAKVVRVRGDVIAPRALEEIAAASADLREAIADKSSDDDKLKVRIEKLDALLRREGGRVYPLGTTADWTETFVIAAILAGGVRAFVFQPFKIPTNSMYPTYHGMTAKAYADNEPEPNPARKAWRKITLGATHYAPPSPVAGEVFIPVRQSFGGSINFDPAGKAIDDGILGTGILKGPADAHRLFVGNTPVTVVTPAEFTFESAILRAYFPKQAAMPATEQERWQAVIAAAHQNGDIVPNGPGEALLRTHKTVRVGEPVIRFDVLTGDMVFVDRLSYNFTKPKLGDAFVFRTRDVPGFSPPRDDFYIKRLVGRPGDTLRVEYPKLFVNGVVASGNPGFDNNNAARHELEYHGYLPDIGGARYPLHDDMKLPDASYWAMGDNSANSSDSRVFGVVPEKALVGRALFIVHPFTDRWGPAK